jgi:nucleotide-binding universal stress UspA family protein
MEEYQIELKKEVNEKFKKYVDQFTDSRDFFKLHIFEGAPAKEILHACKKFKANLLILGSHGHARFSNLLLGSTANRVIQHACCPVMIIK